MLNYLQIENFKSLQAVSIPVEKMNLYFGMNGMGKSSVIQSLLLLRQSLWKNNGNDLDTIYLNGGLESIGTVKEAFCQNFETPEMRFYLKFSENEDFDIRALYTSENADGDILHTENRSCGKFKVNLFAPGCFYYLGAEHIPPQTSYSSVNYQTEGINPLGNRGEYVVPFLAKNGRSIKVDSVMRHPNADSDQLIDQVSAWMRDISPGVRIIAQDIPQEQKSKLSMRYTGSRLTSDDISPINTGFGISYVLPLITELLVSGSGTMLLIENPESHLHPRGQAEIAKLIALASSNGAQIICESHSDHIINGIRVAVHDKVIDNKDVYVGYFSKDNNQNTIVTDIGMDNNGNLSDYPNGLLDEWGLQMSKLF